MMGIVSAMASRNTAHDWSTAGHQLTLDINLVHFICTLPPDTCNTNVAWACYVRSLFGGLNGDMNMLRIAAQVAGSDTWPISCRPVASPAVGDRPPLITRAQDVPWYAADFHCYSQILRMFPEQYGSPSEIKALMWSSSSGVNLRDPATPTLPVYVLETAHKAFAYNLIAKSFK